MNRNLAIIGALLIGAVVLSSCNNTKRRIVGTWESTDIKIDGKNELVVSDNANAGLCGEANATMKTSFNRVTLTIKKDESYLAESRVSSTITVTYDLCQTQTANLDTFFTEEGAWSLVDKNKILFQPKDGKQYECEIIELTKSSLKLKCPCVEDCAIDVLGDNDVDYTIGDYEMNATKK
ncbi:MAG: hypothetical protein GXO48_09650 [Chlorobi bacterium]|nr:hypothetical protein [Chlorobiota bacterium]